MIMEEKCPHCGSENIDFGTSDDEPWDEEFIRTWDCKCEHGHRFIISEVYALCSRIVAKDDDELDELIEKEKKE